jgi:SseB protein N-terminal domain
MAGTLIREYGIMTTSILTSSRGYFLNEIDRLIRAAADDKSPEALEAVCRALDSGQVFYRANARQVDGKQRVSTPLLRLDDGSHALMVYASKTHPDLPSKFGGAPFRHVVKMALDIPAADWLIVTSMQGDWLPIRKNQLAAIRETLGSEIPNAIADEQSDNGRDADLESLISIAVGKPADKWSDALIRKLRGRELYVKLSDQPSDNGRPVMVTSEVGGVKGLVQAYTSRRRPGITYGGMKWEAIVEMVNNATEIPGVHVINDRDDWVVLGRREIQAGTAE